MNCLTVVTIFLKISSSFKRKQDDFRLGTGEAYFTDAGLDCSDFQFLLIAQNKSRLEDCFVATT